MPLKEFESWLSDVCRIYVERTTDEGHVTRFRVLLFATIDEMTHCVTRYDTAHGYAHRDVLGLKEGLRGKLACHILTHDQAFQYAIHDIKQNFETYLADFRAH